MIKKIGKSKWQVLSSNGRSLGVYYSKKAAVQRLRQVEYHKKRSSGR